MIVGRNTAALVVSAILAIAVILAAAPGQAAFPGSNGRIAFARGDDRFVDSALGIWTMRPDGSHRRRVFQQRGHFFYQPEVSPSGRRIAFLRDEPSGLWVMRSNGTRLRRVARGAVSQPAFSPNGRLIAYSSRKGRGSRIFVASPSGTGGHAAVVRFRGSSQGEPAFVNNRRLLYTSFAGLGEGTHLYSVRIDGSRQRQITDYPDEWVSAPDVSPNRRRVVYVDYGEDGICVVGLDGTNRRCLLPAGSDPNELLTARFSPDGDKFVFWEWRRGILTVNRDGSGLRRLTKPGSRAPDWGPRPR